MGKSSITNIVKADQKNSTEPFGKIKDQLDETQALSWRMEQYMAESRNVLTSCVRLKSELQYDYFTELVLEAAKTSEKYIGDVGLQLCSTDPCFSFTGCMAYGYKG